METRPDPASSPGPTSASQDRREAVRRRAQQIYEQSGRIAGRDLENWVQAEREIAQQSAPRKAIVVRVKGVPLVGEYAPADAQGYTPGEFAAGDTVSLRFAGDKMFLKRHNGTELETKLNPGGK